MEITFELLKQKMENLYVNTEWGDWRVMTDEEDVYTLIDGQDQYHYLRCKELRQEGILVYRKQSLRKGEVTKDEFEVIYCRESEIILGNVEVKIEQDITFSSIEWYGVDEEWVRCEVISRSDDIKRIEKRFMDSILELPEFRLHAATGMIRHNQK